MPFTKKRKRRSSNEDNMGCGNKTSRTEASISDLPDLETYEVFLSFRGKETRKVFTDHLYKRLVDAGVWVFRDNEALRVGEEIGPELVKAIRASKISIPIISSDYASSEWCLRELVHILECKKTTGHVVLPIFYQVKPKSVRNQTGTFKKAFHLHNKKYGPKSKVVQEWRNALVEVASLKGWESSKIADGHEAHLVEIVVAEVLKELRTATLLVTDCLVGIEGHKENIFKMVEGKASSNAQAIVIHGMGGIGKTTLAKVIYNQLCSSFKHCCYLPNIRERLTEQKCRPEELQKQLISSITGQQWPNEISYVDEGINIIRDRLKQKKVLILFDDVAHDDQLNALARECSWFNSGSILIITTRKNDVLKKWEDRLTYELNGLDPSLSLLLFCKHAFQKKDECRLREFHTIAEDIVATTGGLPLAIEVIGSMLLNESKGYWEDVRNKLQKIPHRDVQKTLRISYDALDYGHKQIFLDIACLSILSRINFAHYMWDDCEFYPKEGIKELVSRSLIKIEGKNQVTIHDQLRDLGREIVRQDANNDPGNQSRIWDEKEAFEVVQRKQGTPKIRALNLSYYHSESGKNDYFTSEQFKNLTKLRFLWLFDAHLKGDFENLLLDLRWLQWTRCFSIPTNFCPSKLVVLNLSSSQITENWEGWAQIQLVKKLRVLILHHCSYLTSTPDLSAFEKLEILNLSNCRNLRTIHPSIGTLVNLVTLSLNLCTSLMKLPESIGKLKSLSQLELHGLEGMELPNSIRDLDNLNELDMIVMFIECLELPSGIRKIRITYCPTLQQIPNPSGCTMSSSLKIYSCRNLPILGDLGDSTIFCQVNGYDAFEWCSSYNSRAKNLKSLLVQDSPSLMEICGLDNVECLNKLTSLQRLIIGGCNSKIESLDLSKHKNLYSLVLMQFEILKEIRMVLTSLEEVNVGRCEKLIEIKGLQEQKTLKTVRISSCNSLKKLPDISLLTSLEEVNVNRCEKLTEMRGQEHKTLKRITIRNCNSLEKLPDVSLLTSLEEVHVDRCEKLTEIKGLQEQNILKTIRISSCNSLEKLPDVSLLTSLEEVNVNGCEKLTEMRGQEHKTLKRITICNCNSLEKLPNVSLLTSLEEVNVDRCEKLAEIEGSQKQKTLKTIRISSCNSLKKLLDISLLTSLEEVNVGGCEKLIEIKGLQEQKTLKKIRISGNYFEKLPDISFLTSLEMVHVDKCEKLTEIKRIKVPAGQENLRILNLSYCRSIGTLPSFTLVKNLEHLIVKGCEKLTNIKGIPMSLRVLDVSGCKSLVNLPNFSQCCCLEGLFAGGCSKLTTIIGLKGPKKLQILDFSSCKSLNNFPDCSLFTGLKHLCLSGCEKLNEIKGLPISLKTLDISGCQSLVNLLDFSQCRSIEALLAQGCIKLTKIIGLTEQGSLRVLDLSGCKSLEDFPDFSKFEVLKNLKLNGCEKLNGIKGLPISLETLDISGCQSLVNLLDFSRCRSVQALLAQGCIKLTKIIGLAEQGLLRVLDLSGCKSLEDFPDFLKFEFLEHLNLNGCEKLIEINGLPKTLKTLDIGGCKLEELRGLENLDNFRVLAIHGCESLKRKPDLLNDCVRTGPLEKAMRWELTLRINDEMNIDGGLATRVSIVGSNFHINGSEPQTILSSHFISFSEVGEVKFWKRWS